jgi:hypothetical protein
MAEIFAKKPQIRGFDGRSFSLFWRGGDRIFMPGRHATV